MGVKFNWEFNVGTLLTIASFALGGIGIYTTMNENLIRFDMRLTQIEHRADLSPQLQDHETRLRSIEAIAVNARAERLAFQGQVMEILTAIREDVARLKALGEK